MTWSLGLTFDVVKVGLQTFVRASAKVILRACAFVSSICMLLFCSIRVNVRPADVHVDQSSGSQDQRSHADVCP